jgi:hypothetical protein
MQSDAATLEGIANETPAITSKETTAKTFTVHLEKCKWGSKTDTNTQGLKWVLRGSKIRAAKNRVNTE